MARIFTLCKEDLQDYTFYGELDRRGTPKDIQKLYDLYDNLRYVMEERNPIEEKRNPFLSSLQKETETDIYDTLPFASYLFQHKMACVLPENEGKYQKGIYIKPKNNNELIKIYKQFRTESGLD